MNDARLTLGDPAPDLPVTDSAGERLQLAVLWHDRPLVLAFLRHYG